MWNVMDRTAKVIIQLTWRDDGKYMDFNYIGKPKTHMISLLFKCGLLPKDLQFAFHVEV